MMDQITFLPDPEVNFGTVVPPAKITFYPSAMSPGAVSVLLVSNDEFSTIEAGLRLNPEQIEALATALACSIGKVLA